MKNEASGFRIGDLKKRDITVLSYYDILENEDGELMFTVKCFNSPTDKDFKPRLYYDSGAHAIFIKNDKVAAICDHIHPGVRGQLSRVDKVLFGELGDGSIVAEYFADVIHLPDLESLAEELIKLNDKKDEGW